MSGGLRIGPVAAAALLALAVIAARLAGYSAYVVTSGSMEPAIPMGSVIVVESVRPETVLAGDVITYALPDRIVTHRVEAVTWSDGALAFATRGDANAVADPWLARPAGPVGAVRATAPLLGYLVTDVQRWWRLAALVLALWLVLDAAITRLRGRRQPARMPRPAGT